MKCSIDHILDNQEVKSQDKKIGSKVQKKENLVFTLKVQQFEQFQGR